MLVKHIESGKSETCREILESLPQWFGIEEARENYIVEAGNLIMYACMEKGRNAGFLSLRIHNSWNAEIHCMGVAPQFHRQGIGTGLVAAAAEYSKTRGTRFLSVKTLSGASKDIHYAKTRKFYRNFGFEPFEELPDLWGIDNPCLLMIKPLDAGKQPPPVYKLHA